MCDFAIVGFRHGDYLSGGIVQQDVDPTGAGVELLTALLRNDGSVTPATFRTRVWDSLDANTPAEEGAGRLGCVEGVGLRRSNSRVFMEAEFNDDKGNMLTHFEDCAWAYVIGEDGSTLTVYYQDPENFREDESVLDRWATIPLDAFNSTSPSVGYDIREIMDLVNSGFPVWPSQD